MSEHKRYPWERLLDSELNPPRPEVKRRRGRPKSPFPRKRRRFAATEDEVNALNELVQTLKERFNSNVERGHVISFMTFYLTRLLQDKNRDLYIPDDVTSFVDLAKYLDTK
ncbi:MAG: hypothetical protein P8Z41_09535 [Anaerolineales bacterium]|jgi:hypothetical protein